MTPEIPAFPKTVRVDLKNFIRLNPGVVKAMGISVARGMWVEFEGFPPIEASSGKAMLLDLRAIRRAIKAAR